MVSATVSTNVKKFKDFPKLMQSVDEEIIVYFTESRVGTVLFRDGVCGGGEYDKWEMSSFDDFQGVLTLSNK